MSYGIPPMVPYKPTGLTSVVEQSQPDSTKRFVGIYYQGYDATIQRLLRLAGRGIDSTEKYSFPLPTGALKYGTSLAANTPPEAHTSLDPTHLQIYAMTAECVIIDVLSNTPFALRALEDSKIAAITCYPTTRVFYQPEGKENEIAQVVAGSWEVKTVAHNAIKGTNIVALETSLNKIGFLDFDRCLVYHGQDSNLHFWWTEGESPPKTEVIPAGSVRHNSAVAIARRFTKIFVYYLDEKSELHYIVKSENLGFTWGKPQKVENVIYQPREETALTAIIPDEKAEQVEIWLSYQDTEGEIQTINIPV